MKTLNTALFTALAMLGMTLSGCTKPADSVKPAATAADSTATSQAVNTSSTASTSSTATAASAPVTAAAASANTMAGKAITIATEGTYKPFSLTKADGTLGGFDVELMQALCSDMQANCTIKAQDWDGLLPGLMAKKYDVAIDALSITPERQAQVDFSEPYFTNTLVFVTKKGSDLNPDDAAQIDSHAIAAQRSTLSSQWMEKNHPKAKLKLYDTIDNAFMDLASGRSDMMISDKAPAYDWLKTPAGQKFEVKGKEIDVNDKMGIAVRKGDPLRDQLSLALSHIKANGIYDKLNQSYFGGMGNGTGSTASSTTTTTITSTTTTSTKK